MARMAQDIDLLRNARPPLAERVAVEGEPYSTFATLENVTASDGLSVGSLFMPSLSRAFYVDQLTFSSNKALVAQALLGNNLTQTTAQQIHRYAIGPGVPLTVPVRQIFRPHQTTTPNLTNILGQCVIRKVLDATATGAYLYIFATGFQVYDDLDFSADKIMLVVGDSILNGTAGITQKSKSMEWLTRGYFQAQGSRVRVVNKSISGSTSSDHEARRTAGVYDMPQVDYLHYQLGTNDAGVISAATAQANLAAMIAWKRQRYPKAKMIVWGSTPREDNTTETALAAIRTAQQAAVTAAADPTVLFCSLGSAFDRTQGVTVYSAQDTAGQRVHPNDTGHAGAYSVISGFLTAQAITL